MKKILFLFSFLCAHNQLPVGENLKYKVSFSGIEAATGRLNIIKIEMIDNVPTYHVQIKIQTLGITDRLYPIDDRIDIWLEKETLRTVKIEKNISEGNYKKSSVTKFYQKNKYALVDNDTVTIPEDCHSPYSLIYSLRDNQALIKMANLTISTLDGKKVTPVKLQVQKNKEVFVPSGKFLCDKITPVPLIGEKFKNEGKISIWFNNDTGNRVPIKIWLKLKFGSLIMELNDKIN